MKNHIICIWISSYLDENIQDLNFADADAKEVYSLLINNLPNLWYQRLFLNAEALWSTIKVALDNELSKQVTEDDNVIIYFSWHWAKWFNDKNDERIAYLVPYDWIKLDIKNSSIPATFLSEILNSINCRYKCVILDSCFSWWATMNSKGLDIPTPKDSAEIIEKWIIDSIKWAGRDIFTACKHEEQSYEFPRFKHGLFTHYLLQELTSGRSIVFKDIQTEITRNVSADAQKESVNQTPTISSEYQWTIQFSPFKKLLIISPEVDELPDPRLLPMKTGVPEVHFEDKQMEKILNKILIDILSNQKEENDKLSWILFRRYCQKIIAKILEKWEKLWSEKRLELANLWDLINEFEIATLDLFVLVSYLPIYWDKKQNKIAAETIMDLFKFTKWREWYTVMSQIPEVILLDVIYITGIVSLQNQSLEFFKTLLNTFAFSQKNYNGEIVRFWDIKGIHYPDSLEGNSANALDHIRSRIKSYTWLESVCSNYTDKDFEMYLTAQLNFLMCIFMKRSWDWIRADFSRFYWEKIEILLMKIYYDEDFFAEVLNLFDMKGKTKEDLFKVFQEYLREAKANSSGRFWWESMDAWDLDKFINKST